MSPLAGYTTFMGNERRADDEGIPPFDEDAPERPSDDEEMALPGERPSMAEDRVTASEQRKRESLRTRVAREQPEPDASNSNTSDPISGRLVEETVNGKDETGELAANESDDRSGLSAEESAVTKHNADDS